MRASPIGAIRFLSGLLAAGCVLTPGPRQLYDGPMLPREQVGIVRSGCAPDGGLTVMVVAVDGRDVADGCADFAVLPGDHRFDLTAELLAPELGSPMMGSGGVLGAPPSGMGGAPRQGSRIIWQSRSPLAMTCTVQAGQEVVIVGTAATGPDWQAHCQERAQR